MQTKGEFVFKCLDTRDGGEFTNSNGQVVKYDSCYVLKVDELSDKGISERKLKIDKNNTSLISKLKSLQAYDKITLICNVVLYGANAKIVPIDLEV